VGALALPQSKVASGDLTGSVPGGVESKTHFAGALQSRLRSKQRNRFGVAGLLRAWRGDPEAGDVGPLPQGAPGVTSATSVRRSRGLRSHNQPVKPFVDSPGRRKFRGNRRIEGAVPAMAMAGRLDPLVSDGAGQNVRARVAAVQRNERRVTGATTVPTQPPMFGDDLRRQAGARIKRGHLFTELGRDRSAPRLLPHRGGMVRRAC
jgi:hypothetical protein